MLAHVAFLGGAALPLLLTDARASNIRPTNDVDAICAMTYHQYEAIGAFLRARGFTEDTSDQAPICRWQVDDLVLDLMPIDENVFGFSNRWYTLALQFALPYAVSNQLMALSSQTPARLEAWDNSDFDRLTIRLVTAPHFVATKLEAFGSRGNDDIYASRDLEDVITLIAHRSEVVMEVQSESNADARDFISTSISRMLRLPNFEEAVEGHLSADARNRLGEVMNRLRQIGRIGTPTI